MKAVIQHLGNGLTEVAELPRPVVRPGHLLIRTRASLISAGTERMLVEFGKAGWIAKARSQPEKVRQVLDKISTDGLFAALEAVRGKLDAPIALGYCNAGIVLNVGAGISGWAQGDRVASNGPHAEVVAVPANLCARIPDGVSDEAAAFTVAGAIALEGIRLIAPTLGETVVVSGLGLLGLLAVGLLRTNGCRVVGLDISPERCALARRFGAEAVVDLSRGEDPASAVAVASEGRGADAVLLTVAAKSNEPVHQAAQLCRKRGRIVLVGVTGLELSRDDFYKKELSFQVSCSYGPGRYDLAYEEGGHDYPVGFVRWTAQRNFEAVLTVVASGGLDPTPLLSHRFPIAEAGKAYELLTGGEPSLGILLSYSQEGSAPSARTVALNPTTTKAGKPVVAVIGAGGYASRHLLPALKAMGAELRTVVSNGGLSAFSAARKSGAGAASTDGEAAIADPAVDTLVIATRHDSHAHYVLAALAAGKHVFVEKPLATRVDKIEAIAAALAAPGPKPLLMVGFNRRFAPQVVKLKGLLASVSEPKSFIVTVNAGAIPPEHWTQDAVDGGGRIIGEACHFIDLLRHLAGAPIISSLGRCLGRAPGLAIREDKAAITLEFADGSLGTIHYLANGHRAFPKERIEVFCAGRVVQLDNFCRMRAWGWPRFSRLNLWRQDKGNAACITAFIAAVSAGGPPPIPVEELLEVARVTIGIAGELRQAL